jgi:hypothetical protein
MTACWQGLRPGQTTSTELETFFRSSPLLSGGFHTPNYGDDFVFYIRGSFTAVTHGDYLYSIELFQAYNLTLREIVNTLGSPNYISISYRTGSEVSFLEGFLEMYYPDEGFVFYSGYSGGLEVNLTSNNTVDVCIGEDDVVTRIYIQEPGTIAETLNSRNLKWSIVISEEQMTNAINQLRQWSGFNCINLP